MAAHQGRRTGTAAAVGGSGGDALLAVLGWGGGRSQPGTAPAFNGVLAAAICWAASAGWLPHGPCSVAGRGRGASSLLYGVWPTSAHATGRPVALSVQACGL
eukprot:365387-Chlamydomonas_euryale.AAC.20